MKYLVVNADDFGYSKGINKGIIKAHKEGIVTSTSLMVNGQAAEEAKVLKKYPKLSVGLHFDISGEGIKADVVNNILVPLSDSGVVEKEFNKQVDQFKRMVGRFPDHLDSHKHSHMHAKVRPIFQKYSKEHNVPVRAYGDVNFIEDYFGWNKLRQRDFKRVNVESLIKILDNLQHGLNELMCHPGIVDDSLKKISKYTLEREEELKTLTDEKIIKYIKDSGIRLVNWTEAWSKL